MKNFLIIIIGKMFSKIICGIKIGCGSTWPGHIALRLNNNIINDIINRSKTRIVLISGTNGKTTTGKLISSILKENDHNVINNIYGANLLNGIASLLVLNSSLLGKIKSDYLVLEVDENALIKAIEHTNPDFIILLNLFRDQLDRYGEIETIKKKWEKSIKCLDTKTKLILNADDPLIASLGINIKNDVYYFGLDDRKIGNKTIGNVADSIICTNCHSKLCYDNVYFSHLGNWYCPKCKLKKPKLNIDNFSLYPLPGIYNKYNTLAAALFARLVDIKDSTIKSSFEKFEPAFGRQEKIKTKGKDFHIFLSKNPTSFNESLRTINSIHGNNFFIILNNRIPDGKDVSWIYDVDFENLINKNQSLTISGDRAYDMATRIKYADKTKKINTFKNYKDGINFLLKSNDISTIYVLATYSAMLEIRKELIRRKSL